MQPANYKKSLNSRKVAERRARPAWCNLKVMRAYYELAEQCRTVGVNIQVDHIVPLRGKAVCGLDCEDNYQLLLASVNSSKNNDYA